MSDTSSATDVATLLVSLGAGYRYAHENSPGYNGVRANFSGYGCRVDSSRADTPGSSPRVTWSFREPHTQAGRGHDHVAFSAFHPGRVGFFGGSPATALAELGKQDALDDWLRNHHGGTTANPGTYVTSVRRRDYQGSGRTPGAPPVLVTNLVATAVRA